ncbi:MAG TPA: NAD-dependent epimerase/dehydratase family protein [Vicinamibacterales bacterium]|nr:NAD-dependent epimerase/dehydratase family protein [Vicinamibacterales bacterium]
MTAPASYVRRPVAVIGGFGFIGWNLVDRLVGLGARVTVVTRALDRHRAAAAAIEARGVAVREGDLRDAAAMREAVLGQEIVFNLAGQSGAADSMRDPWTDLDVNCRGNLVLLEALRERAAEAKLVFVSSRLAYGRVGPLPAREDRAPDPLCIHAVHKLAVEQYLAVYGHAHGLRFAAARLTNPYGPGQPRERTAYGVVNRLIHLALSGDVLSIYGDGRQQRDYIFIDDAVAALLALGASNAADGRIYNVGSGVGTPMIEMARGITAIAGGGRVEFVEWPHQAAQIETGDFVADISRIRCDLGWEPCVTLSDGLARTVAFYRAQAA